ncbi:hypothetical protein [Caudoviricetes sp.]|nr:hypothetical protein [Caudoviricetes sp.]
MTIYELSKDYAKEAARLIQEYLYKGGTGFDAEKLERVMCALLEADEIEIDNGEEE